MTPALPLVDRVDGETRIVLGPGTSDSIHAYLDELGARRAYVVTGPTLDAGPVGHRLRGALGAMLVGTYASSEPHVPTSTADVVASEARRLEADVLVGVGGGSPIGTAKAAAFRLGTSERGEDAANCYVAAVPTTYAGSEVTPVFGTTDVARGRKEVLRAVWVRPRLALYDPELAVYTPAALTAATGMNALAHCAEGLYSRAASDDDRARASVGAKTLVDHLPRCVRNLADVEERYRMYEGSIDGGLVLAHAGMALHHAICHVLGGKYRVSHGELNAIILPHALEFNLPHAEAATRELARVFGVDRGATEGSSLPEKVARATSSLVASLGLPTRLRQLRIPRPELPAAAADVMASKSLANNPRPIQSSEEVLGILQAAW